SCLPLSVSATLALPRPSHVFPYTTLFRSLPLHRAIDALTQAPARCLGINAGQLVAGRRANLCILNPTATHTPRERWCSAGKNSPWIDARLAGVIQLTITDGRITWENT